MKEAQTHRTNPLAVKRGLSGSQPAKNVRQTNRNGRWPHAWHRERLAHYVVTEKGHGGVHLLRRHCCETFDGANLKD